MNYLIPRWDLLQLQFVSFHTPALYIAFLTDHNNYYCQFYIFPPVSTLLFN
jgi:hypothetical protein